VPGVDRAKLRQEILDTVHAHDMAPGYEAVCLELGVAPDGAQLERMRAANAARLEALDAAVKDAEENLGEVEVRDALHAKADYLADIGDREGAGEAYAATEAKTAGAGLKMDLAFSLLRLDMSRGDWAAVKAGLARATALCASGGDWERKNKLKVYDGLFLLATRQFKPAAERFLDSTATFTATELMPYARCVFYTVALAVVALDRPTLKARVVDSPEVLAVVDAAPHLHAYLDSLHACRYADFFAALAGLSDALRADRALHPHFRFYLREVRRVAYSQFLESYKSVTLEAMAAAFGVSAPFMDGELAEFIAAGRLPAKIDRVAGVVETTRPDAKNALYQGAIRQGDHLLNKLQKLTKVVDIE
jgi:26S proteasome regulatory subunit N7